MLAERIKQRRAVTPAKSNVRYVKFTPEEMAIDADDIDASNPPLIARSREDWERFLSFKRGYVRLDGDLREAFESDEAVNQTLRKAVEIAHLQQSPKRRKRKAG